MCTSWISFSVVDDAVEEKDTSADVLTLSVGWRVRTVTNGVIHDSYQLHNSCKNGRHNGIHVRGLLSAKALPSHLDQCLTISREDGLCIDWLDAYTTRTCVIHPDGQRAGRSYRLTRGRRSIWEANETFLDFTNMIRNQN